MSALASIAPAFVFGRPLGCAGLAVLVLEVFCIVKIVDSATPTANKVLWIVLVLLFPFVGAILWLIFGKR